jgi:glutamate racemase
MTRIGVFDSGVGGLTVAGAIKQVLPNEPIVYFGDTAHLPYGDKSEQALTQYSECVLNFLEEQGCEFFVVACNSASTVLNKLPDKWKHHSKLINVIDPVVDAVVKRRLNTVNLIGTKRTVLSNAYQDRLSDKGIQVNAKATPLLVPVIEEGLSKSLIADEVINHYFDHWDVSEGLILGCTHFPLISEIISKKIDPSVEIFEAPALVADQVKAAIGENPHSDAEKDRFYVTDLTENFASTANMFFGEKAKMTHINFWE